MKPAWEERHSFPKTELNFEKFGSSYMADRPCIKADDIEVNNFFFINKFRLLSKLNK